MRYEIEKLNIRINNMQADVITTNNNSKNINNINSNVSNHMENSIDEWKTAK